MKHSHTQIREQLTCVKCSETFLYSELYISKWGLLCKPCMEFFNIIQGPKDLIDIDLGPEH